MLKQWVQRVFIGSGTKWCVSMRDPKENRFNWYEINNNTLFFILRKDLPQSNPKYKIN